MPRKGKVTLDTRGLKKFQNSLGNGVTLTPGLFNAEQATKGYFLEYGIGTTQVARPWLSQIFSQNSKTYNQILYTLKDLVEDALKGTNSKMKAASRITLIVQNHVLDQNFEAFPLKKSTVARKKRRGAVAPSHIGLDQFDMVDSIKTTFKGGKRTR